MAELMFGLNQTKKKKTVDAKVRKDKSEEWNYKAKGPDGLEAYRFEQTERDQKQKETARETKKNLKDIKAKGPDGLEAYRFEQTQKEAEWKKTGTLINYARMFFASKSAFSLTSGYNMVLLVILLNVLQEETR
jgi:hypothetical protein